MQVDCRHLCQVPTYVQITYCMFVDMSQVSCIIKTNTGCENIEVDPWLCGTWSAQTGDPYRTVQKKKAPGDFVSFHVKDIANTKDAGNW